MTTNKKISQFHDHIIALQKIEADHARNMGTSPTLSATYREIIGLKRSFEDLFSDEIILGRCEDLEVDREV